ncbi:MAG: hypothetical protein FWG98_11335 [Candidatus Cloacimonetes bacterium]|nr:hypothetical protein [Candidatus Cloacimonadota bacterium]
MENNLVVVIVGYLASAIVAYSMMLRSIIQLRLINMVGAIFVVLYCLFIRAYPLLFLNAFMALVNMYYLLLYYNRRGHFRILRVDNNATYLNEFLLYYYNDIVRYFPKFMSPYDEDYTYFYVLRDMIVTGIFIVKVNLDETAEIMLDYVIPEYRDTRIGLFIYNDNDNYFKDIGIQTFILKNPTPKQRKYLKGTGFKRNKGNPKIFEKKLKKTW